jgi:hypothetical protein
VTEARRVCLSILSALEERIGDDDLVTEYRMNPWVAALVHELSGGVQTQ